MNAEVRAPNQARRVDSSEARRRWREARAFEAEARRALARERCSFIEWLVLQTLQELELDAREGLPQTETEIAQRTGLSRQVVSYWLVGLDERGLVARGMAESPGAWAVLITDEGEEALTRCNERLEAAGLSR